MRASHAAPGSSFAYSTLPPGSDSSYGLIAASPTKTTRQSGPYVRRSWSVPMRSDRRRALSRHTQS
jgi:hypothetical protein